MSLLRFAARSMLASFFVVNGYRAFRHPEPLTDAAEPLAKTFLPLAERTLPPQLAVYLPEDAKGLVRCTGITQMIGALCLATGIGRRLGAGLLTATMVPHVLASNPFSAHAGKERDAAQAILLRNVALTGGVLLASLDTEGRPDLVWRARTGKEAIEREAKRAKAALVRDAKRAARRAGSVANQATRQLGSSRS